MGKGILQLVAVVLFAFLAYLWIGGSSSKKPSTPKPTTFQTQPTESKPVPFKEPPAFSGEFGSKKEGLASDLVEVLMTNTMGNFNVDNKAEKKLQIIVDELFEAMHQEIFDAYKDKRVNLAKLDTMSNPELYKLLE